MDDGLRVLVTDDQEVMREFICRVLSARGHLCDTAGNGRECLARLQAQPYDLLFLDLIMPGMDGKQTLVATRKLYPVLPVVIISVQDCERDILHLLDIGATAFLSKPFTANDIQKVADQVLSLRNASDDLSLASE